MNAPLSSLTLLASALGLSAEVGDAGPAPDGGTSALEMKCGNRPDTNPDWPEIVFIVDYERADIEPGEFDQKAYDIDHVEIICWRQVEHTYGIKVNNGAALVLTKQLHDKTIDGVDGSLTDLVELQERHRRETGGYASGIDALPGYEPPPGLTVFMFATVDGWAATAMHDVARGTCFAFVGTAPEGWETTRPAHAPPFAERAPVCYRQDVARSAGPGSG